MAPSVERSLLAHPGGAVPMATTTDGRQAGPSRFCTACGRKLEPAARFCQQCGAAAA